jgi:hypothetical protein
MQQFARSNYEYLQIFRLGSGTRQQAGEYPRRSGKASQGQRKKPDFSKMLDKEMHQEV